jgi:hypothetical protein
VTPLAALLTLALAAPPAPAAAASPAPPPPHADGVEALEHVALPSAPAAVRVRSLAQVVVLSAPSNAAALARAIRSARRAVCPEVETRPGEVVLRCRSNRVVARVVPRAHGALLELAEARGLPWSGDDAPPLLPFDPERAGLGKPCPGSTPSGRAECLLARGDEAAARAALAEEGAVPDHAALRLGDLAHAAGDLRAAATHWAHVEAAPWARLAAARLCELAAPCLAAPRAAALFATEGLPPALARDLAARWARALAFAGQPLEALRALAEAAPEASACAAAPALCQRVAAAALRLRGPPAAEALTLWVELPARDRGPAAWEAQTAAALVAERHGAPAFAAGLLASAAARAPAAELPEHLLRTAELYLAAGDRVRAGVVLDFARARARRDALPGPRWAAVARAVNARAAPGRTGTSRADAPVSDPRALLAAADRAAQAARALADGGRP